MIHLGKYNINTKHCSGDLNVYAAYYADGSTVILIQDGELTDKVATVYIEKSAQDLPFVWLKGWSKNQGLPEALEQCGLLELTGVTWPMCNCVAQLAKLNDGAVKIIKSIEDQ